MQRILKRFIKSNLFWPVTVMCLLLLFNLIFTKGFFNFEIKDGHLFGSIIDILNRGSSLVIMAIGMTLVVATGGIDISVGSMVAISGAVAASLIGGELVIVDGVQEYVTLVPLPVALLITLLVAIVLGMWNGTLVSRVGIQPVVATLILLTAGRGIAQLITKGQIITIYYEPYNSIGGGYFLGLPFPVFVTAAVLIAAMLAVKKTALGTFLVACGCNPVASEASGIKVKRIVFWCYVFSSFCAGIAGILITSNVKSADGNNAGLFKELDVILAVALGGNSLNGGRFSIMGSVLGALIVQTIDTTIYSIGVQPQSTKIVKALIIIGICLLQSDVVRNKLASLKARKKGGISIGKEAAEI